MHPEIHIHYLAVVVAALAAFFFGWIWHGPLFGKTWAALMKFPADFKPTSKQMMQGMILALVGSLLTAFVLAHSVEVWRPLVWKVGQDQGPAVYGFFAGFFTWLGFYVPMLFGAVAWEGKSDHGGHPHLLALTAGGRARPTGTRGSDRRRLIFDGLRLTLQVR